MKTLSRRGFLAIGAGFVGAIGGCLGLDSGQSPGTPTDPDDPTATTGTDGGGTASDTPAPDRVEEFYLENFDEQGYVVEVSITEPDGRAGNGQIESGRYEILPQTGLMFGNIGKEGMRYEVRARFEGGQWETFEWDVRSCEMAPTGKKMGARVQIQEGSLSYSQTACDVVADPDLEYHHESTHAIDESST